MKTLIPLLLLISPLQAAPPRPNIIVILVDDMGFSGIGCYGSEILTPNIDRLAAEGLRFRQFHNTGRCSPTRASLLTGLYQHQAGMGNLDNNVIPGSLGWQGKLRDDCVTMAEVLGDGGYFTAMTGKWHLGQDRGCAPWTRGFQYSLNSARGGIYYSNQTGSKGGAKLYLDGREMSSDDPAFSPPWYGTDLWTDWGIKFIDQGIAEKKPFFLYLANVAPHFPCMSPEATIAKYRGTYMKGWDKLREERYQRQIRMGLIDPKWALDPRPASIPAWESLSDAEKKRYDDMMAIYAAIIDEVDKNVGKLVAALKERKRLDNTLIFFLSDNGGNAESGVKGVYHGDHPGDPHSEVFIGECWAHLNNTPFRKYKHFVHEGGAATPLIARWPAGIVVGLNGKFDDSPGHLVDIMATAVDLSGASYPKTRGGHDIQPMEGVSLKPAFSGKPVTRANPLFFEHEGNRAVRDGKWKIVSFKNKPWELFDMDADRSEQHDLAAKMPEKVNTMSAQWDSWAVRASVDAWQRTKKPGGGKKKKAAKKP